MLALLSPAKTLDYERPLPDGLVATRPRLATEAGRIARAAAALSAADLERIMGISEKLATLNVARFKGFRRAPERPALFAFAGDVYTGFEARSLEAPAIDFAQDHVRMLSGLYGLLRPLDAMRPYRLEMGTRWAPDAASLYAHWGDRIGKLLAKDLRAEGSGTIVNLASKEYWHAIAQAPPRKAAIYDIEFMDDHGADGLRFNSFAAKKARGMMARYLCEHRIGRVEDLKGFDSDGYAFDPAGSDERRWRFVRTLHGL
jgi:cytoplasmic iron level regulating protein YaaA (DUF328/UPF0246 family)